MKEGTYTVTVSGFLTKETALAFSEAIRRGEGFDESGLEVDLTVPMTKSFRVQEAEVEVETNVATSKA